MAENIVPLASSPITLGDRLRANAALLEAAVKARRLGIRDLRAMAADLGDRAAEADRLAEAQAWLNCAVRGPVTRKAAA